MDYREQYDRYVAMIEETIEKILPQTETDCPNDMQIPRHLCEAMRYSLLAGVRRSTGRNAAVINHIVEGLSGKGFNFDDEHLKELVGHTPIQVLAGALLGILVGVLMA